MRRWRLEFTTEVIQRLKTDLTTGHLALDDTLIHHSDSMTYAHSGYILLSWLHFAFFQASSTIL